MTIETRAHEWPGPGGPFEGFLAFDGRSRVVGRFDALTAAMAAVTNGQPPQDAEITLQQVRVPAPRGLGQGGVR